MARARSPGSIEAEKLYQDGMKLVDIAKKIGVPDSTVRRWKSTQRWDESKSEQSKKKETERSDKKKPNARKSKGAPRGNKNAAGHAPSVPRKNKNAQKHGAFSKLYFKDIDEEEWDMISCMEDTEEGQLIMQLQLFSIRERRLMNSIMKYRNMELQNNGLAVDGVSKTKKIEDLTDVDGVSLESGKYKKNTETTVTHTKAVMSSIVTLETELTKLQKAKTKAIEALAHLRLENQKMENETAGNDTVDDWMLAMMGENVENGR